MTGQMICQKGNRLLRDVNSSLSQEKQFVLNFTKGWLRRFQKRWKLQCRKVHGEGGDADEVALQREFLALQSIFKDFAVDDIWNADETGMNYCMTPDRKI